VADQISGRPGRPISGRPWAADQQVSLGG